MQHVSIKAPVFLSLLGWAQEAAECTQVFDSGLIGEGVLHLLAWAQARLLTPDCTLVSTKSLRHSGLISNKLQECHAQPNRCQSNRAVPQATSESDDSERLRTRKECRWESEVGCGSQVPMAATVFCQPIQMRTERVLGFDMAQANCWRWRPDYEGLDLGLMKCVQAAPRQVADSSEHQRYSFS